MLEALQIQWESGEESARNKRYTLFEMYYTGDHIPQLPSRKLQSLTHYTGFRANLCDVIIDTMAERLNVLGFTTPDDDEAIEDRCAKLWELNRLDDDQSTIHTEATKLGDAYVLVDWDQDNKRPRMNFNPAHMISVKYEDAGSRRMSCATKRWVDCDIRRKNVYYPDRVERYFAPKNDKGEFTASNWRPYTDDNQPAVIPWIDRRGRPLGIPIIPFRNKANGKPYGRSELTNVVPLQDAINKTLVDLLLVMDSMGWPQRWVRGTRPPGGWNVGPGIVWSANDPNFEAGELAQATPDGLLSALDKLINIAAGRSRTPQHLFHIEGVYPSGESLKTAETGLAGKVRDRQVSFGNSWEDAFILALKLDNTFGGKDWKTDDLILQTVWRDPETKNDLMLAQAVSTKAPWLSHNQILREFGYTDAQVATILAEFKEDQQAKNDLGGQLLDAFNKGALPGDPGTGTPDDMPEPGDQATNRNSDR